MTKEEHIARLEIIKNYLCAKKDIESMTYAIETLKQEPKTGHWNSIPKYPDIAWCCSECEHFTTMKHNYCPNCGCRMESEG